MPDSCCCVPTCLSVAAESAYLLECLITSAPRLIMPYVSPIQKALVAKLRGVGTPPSGGMVLPVANSQGGEPCAQMCVCASQAMSAWALPHARTHAQSCLGWGLGFWARMVVDPRLGHLLP